MTKLLQFAFSREEDSGRGGTMQTYRKVWGVLRMSTEKFLEAEAHPNFQMGQEGGLGVQAT